MKLQATFAGNLFEGDLILPLRGLPQEAQVSAATAQITPTWDDVDVLLPGNPADHWGITWDGDTLDFHARRTVRAVRVGTTTGTAHVQIDMGGIWVRLNNDGSLSVPDDGKSTSFAFANNVIDLQSVATSRIRVTNAATGGGLSYERVTLGSAPTNAALFVGTFGPVWIQVGEMRAVADVPDFAAVLAACLPTAEIVDGYSVIPFKLHSDGIACLTLALTLEYDQDQAVLPPAVRDAHLDYGYDPVPQSAAPLTVSLPPNAHVLPGGTRLQVIGSFDASRVVYGPKTPVNAGAVVSVSSGVSQAQPLTVPQDLNATAIDLLVEPLTPVATLSITLLGDAGGKPFGQSLLPRPITLQLEQVPGSGVRWASAPLPAEFTFAAQQASGAARRYWVVVNSNAGDVSWGVAASAADGTGLQASRDGGLSWQAAQIARVPGTINAHVRLRYPPAQYAVPLKVQVGNAPPVALDAYSPLGKVDFTIDFPALADAFNTAIAQAGEIICREAEYVANGNFEHWYGPEGLELPEDWALMSGMVWPRRGRDQFNTMAILQSSGGDPGALSQVLPASGGCGYTFQFYGEASHKGAYAEITWLGDCLTALRTDTVPIEVSPVLEAGSPAYLIRARLHRAYLDAPSGATQAELRFIVPPRLVTATDENGILIDDVSLIASADMVRQGDLGMLGDNGLPDGWTLLPLDAAGDVRFNPGSDDCAAPTQYRYDKRAPTVIRNCASSPITLLQPVTVTAGRTYTLETHLAMRYGVTGVSSGHPQLELHWLDASGADAAEPVIQVAEEHSATPVPHDVTAPTAQAELRLVIPPGVDLGVWSIDLREQVRLAVPVTFLAEAPGELTVTDAHVAYELAEPAPPAVPSGGLCFPTPPDRMPGTSAPDPCCYCCQCGGPRQIQNAVDALTPNRRPAAVGTCDTCGASLTRLGGQAAGGRTTAEVRTLVGTTSYRPEIVRAIRSLKLADINGIAEARTRELAALGIHSVARLATANAADVAQVKNVDLAKAVDFIHQARAMILGTLSLGWILPAPVLCKNPACGVDLLV